VLIVTWANGLAMSLRAARRLAQRGVSCRVFDLRWLAPMPIDEVLRHADQVGRVLVVDETRASGGVGEGIVAGLVEGGFRGPLRRVAAADSFVPLGDAANLVLVSVDEVVDAALELTA
jgi:2-oxoisovalerate dehydrogenase E1 component